MSDIVERLLTPCRDWDGSEMADNAETLSTMDCGTMREAAETILALRKEVEALRDVIAPFTCQNPHKNEDGSNGVLVPATIADIRRARAALATENSNETSN